MSYKVPKGLVVKIKKKRNEVSQCLKAVSNGNTINRDSKLKRNRARTWCFTLNNYSDEDVVSLSHDKWEDMKIKKLVFQEETGKKNVKHLQGVVQFTNQISFSQLKKFNGKIHWSKCRDIKASIKYCSKEETRTGDIYKYGDVDKNLWKDKKKLMTVQEVYEDMESQMINHDNVKDIVEEWCQLEKKRYGDKYKHILS